MKKQTLLYVVLVVCSFWGCTEDDNNVTPINPSLVYETDFASGPDGWEGNFVDLPTQDTDHYELTFSHTTLPFPLDSITEGEKALLLKGANRSDDLFMYISRKFEGLMPNTTYVLSLTMEIAAEHPWGMIGIGGAPAESVFLKAGMVNFAPERLVSYDHGYAEGYYVLNLDKGNQSEGGRDMKILGNVGFDGEMGFRLIEVHNSEVPIEATSNANGELWVLIGTDSGFEGTTELYYNRIQLFLNEK